MVNQTITTLSKPELERKITQMSTVYTDSMRNHARASAVLARLSIRNEEKDLEKPCFALIHRRREEFWSPFVHSGIIPIEMLFFPDKTRDNFYQAIPPMKEDSRPRSLN